jgi:hypothetical protein
VITAAVGLLFVAMGLYALAVPVRVLAIFGVTVTSLDGRNEVRAVYGGFGVAIGILLLAAPGLPALRDGVLVTVAIALLGMAGGRLAAAAVDGAPGPLPWLFLGLEALGAVALLWSTGVPC